MDELRTPHRGLNVVRSSQNRAGLGQGVNHEAVPFGQDLLVAAGMDAALARLEEDRAAAGDNPRKTLLGDLELLGGVLRVVLRVQDAGRPQPFLKIAARGHVEVRAEERTFVRPQQRGHLGRRPHEELALDSLAVRIL